MVRLTREVLVGAEPDAVSCFGHSLIALDAAGRPLTPVPLMAGFPERDAGPRAPGPGLDGAAVHARTGQYLPPTRATGPRSSRGWPRRAGSSSDSRRSRFVSFADYSKASPVTSPSLASGTGLLDLGARAWDEELLDSLGSTPGACRSSPNVPVWIDGVCANLGTGCLGSRAALSVGTSAALRILYETDRPRPRPGTLFSISWTSGASSKAGALSDSGGNPPRLARRDTSATAALSATITGYVSALPRRRALDGLGSSCDRRRDRPDLRDDAGRPPPGGARGGGLPVAAIAELLPEIEAVVALGWRPSQRPGVDPDHGRRPSTGRSRIRGRGGIAPRCWPVSAVGTNRLRGGGWHHLGKVFEPHEGRAEAYRSARERQLRLYEEPSWPRLISSNCRSTPSGRLRCDAVQKAGIGHPGNRNGARAPRPTLLYYREEMNHNPANPQWPEPRPASVLSAGTRASPVTPRSISRATTSRSRS